MIELMQAEPALPLSVQRHLPKHVRLKLTLRERLKKLQPGDALPSISALQAEFGIAQGTVTRVLRELQADGLVEARHGSGVFATGRVHLKTIAIYMGFDVLAAQAGAFPQLLLKGLEAVAGQFEDIQYRYYLTPGTFEGWCKRVCGLEQDVRRRLVDGVIVLGIHSGALGDLQAPVVALHAQPGVTHCVELDLDALIKRAMATLKARGCQRVALLGPTFAEPLLPQDEHYKAAHLIRQRAAFFRAEAARQGMETRTDWACGVDASAGIDQVVSVATRAFTAAWQAAAEKPDGLICLDDYMATGAIRAMRELGLEPGREIQVVTHANRGSDVLAGLPVTAVEFDPSDIARTLLETTRKIISGVRLPATVLVQPVLHERSSTVLTPTMAENEPVAEKAQGMVVAEEG